MARAALAILNELSLSASGGLSEAEIESAVSDFVATMKAARRVRDDIALVSQQSLSTIEVDDDGLTLSAFLQRRGGRCRELLRFIRILMNHAPIASAPSLKMPDDGEEFRCEDQPADGLGFAASNRQLATSLHPGHWGAASLPVTRTWLDEEGEDVVVREETLTAVHASTPSHIAEHEQFLRQISLPEVLSGDAVWADRRRLFPALEFLPRVEVQIVGLTRGSKALAHVFSRLRELDEAVREWAPTKSPFPSWRSEVTPEHEQRKRLCMFSDLDGQPRCFDLHARFKPGAGRIHFRLEPAAQRRLVVAHVGRKLGI